MICACRYDNAITFPDNVFFCTVENEPGFPLFDPEELVHLAMYLVADLLAFLQAHQDELGVFAGKDHLAKKTVLFSQFFDGPNKSGHMFFLLVWLLKQRD